MKKFTLLKMMFIALATTFSATTFGASYTFNFSEMGYANGTSLASTTASSTDGFIQLSFAKNSASTAPSYYTTGTAVRLYQDASGVKGGSIIVSGLNGATITGVTAVCYNSSASDSAYFRYDIGGGTVDFSSCDVSGLSTSSFECFTVGTSSSQRVYVQSLTITYTEGSATAAAIPTFSPESGDYTSAQSVTISNGSSTDKIYYTLDGTDPSSASSLFSSALTISDSTTVKAIAYDSNDANPSSIVSATYNILPVTDVANIAAFLADSTDAKSNLYKITGAVTVTFQSGSNTFIHDDSGNIIIYGSTGQTLSNGSTLTGIVGKYSYYRGVLEFIPTTIPTAETGTAVSPTSMDIASITNADQAKYVELTGVNLHTGSKYFVSGSDSIAYYDPASVLTGTYDASTAYTVTGVLTVYSYSPEIYISSIEETSGISDKTASNDIVVGEAGYILATLAESQPIKVYSILGVKVASINGTEGENVINLPKGLYIVTVGSKASKVLVK